MPPDAKQTATLVLDSRLGKQAARDELSNLVRDEVLELAAAHLAGVRAAYALQPTTLLSALHPRLLGGVYQDSRENELHVLAIGARILRRILVDHARGQLEESAGEPQVKLSLAFPEDSPHNHQDLLAVDEALRRLESLDPIASHVAELKFFGGLTDDQIAEVVALPSAAIQRNWKFARAWVISELLPSDDRPR